MISAQIGTVTNHVIGTHNPKDNHIAIVRNILSDSIMTHSLMSEQRMPSGISCARGRASQKSEFTGIPQVANTLSTRYPQAIFLILIGFWDLSTILVDSLILNLMSWTFRDRASVSVAWI